MSKLFFLGLLSLPMVAQGQEPPLTGMVAQVVARYEALESVTVPVAIDITGSQGRMNTTSQLAGLSALARTIDREVVDLASLMRCPPGEDFVSGHCFLDGPSIALRIGNLDIRENKAQLWFESIATGSDERTVGLTGLRADFDLRPGSGWVLAEIIVTRIP